MITDARFEACLPLILKEEGGNDDDPQDHGGRTSRGITQREYTAWCVKRGLPDGDVWAAPNITIDDIYYNEYWLPRGPKLHPGVDLVFFNFAVNAGAGEAHKLLMRSIGPDDVDDDPLTINRMCNEGEAFYRGLAQFPRYGRGWTSRTERIRAAALRMQKEATVGPHDPLPPQKPKPQPQPDPVIIATEGHTMVDVTTLIKDLNIGLDVAEKLEPLIASVQPSVGAGILAFLRGIRAVESSLGLAPPAAGLFNPTAAEKATDHVTPGQPNSPVLGPNPTK
jgi:lysozyme family protein